VEHTKFAGHRWTDADDKDKVSLYCAVDVVKGRPYCITYGVYGEQASLPATETAINKNEVVIALDTISSGNIGKFQEGGTVEEAYVGQCAAGDHLEVLDAGESLVVDGTSGETVRSVKTCAMALTANADVDPALRRVLLYRNGCQVAAA
jgi:hypothetical protein